MAAETARAAHSTALAPTAEGELPAWIQLLPAGTFAGVDGRGPYSVPDPEMVIRRTREETGGNDLPIDFGHALEVEGHTGDAAPAAGWISDFEVREGEIWGRVAWTPGGESAVRGRTFRFLSPVFYHTHDGVVRWIVRAGLTNRPNLRLKAVHSKQTPERGEETTVAEKTEVRPLAPVAAALGLTEAADDTAIVARASHAAQAVAGLAKVAQSVDLGADATPDQVIQAIHARTTPDPTRFVPREQYDNLATELRGAQSRERERIVEAAIAEGKLTPAQREWALSYHSRDPAGFTAFVGVQPVIVSGGAAAHAASGGGTTGRELDADAKAVCARLGISEADYLKHQGGS